MRSASSVPVPRPGANAAIMKKVTVSRKARPKGDARRDARSAPPPGNGPRRGKRADAPTPDDDILPEYDFRDGVPNPYAGRYAATVAEGACLVTIDPDVAAVFPDSASVNEALRALARIIRQHRGGAQKRKRS